MRDEVALSVFGNNVKYLRNKIQISQEKLAELSDLDRTYISSVERGQRNVSILNIIKIAEALNVNINSLFNGIGGCNE